MSLSETQLRRTALYQNHKEQGAKLVDFHGWELPIQYEGIIKEHQAVRNACGIFDVSHMGQVWVEGPQALALLQKACTNDISRAKPGRGIYTHMANEAGGVVDDVIVSCLAKNRYLMVVNAATAEKDFAWLKRHARGLDADLENASERFSMIALQGPRAAEVLAFEVSEAAALPRFGALERDIFDQPGVVTRTGYTGEDGFEIIVPNEIVARIWNDLLARGRSFGLLPCGLGARDTLRLEAGYLLYGQDVDDKHTSLEAGYGWVVKWDKGDFIGRKALEKQKAEGLRRRLTGIRLKEPGVPRAGCRVLSGGREIGALASATFSPSLRVGIGVGYFSDPDLKPGSLVSVGLHGREAAADVAAVPFYRRPGN